MAHELLSRIHSADDLKSFSEEELTRLSVEIREALCDVVAARPAHFASNLGVVELCLALHLTFDFKKDRLIWDTGHQIYPHKLVTGRYQEFHTIRTKGGLMGYPNPQESEYDLFVTGHAGSSVSTVLGLQAADELLRPEEGRKAVAVIGDGALPSGVVFEAFNNAAGKNSDVLVILNDNEMGICPRVGGIAQYLDQARVKPFYDGLKGNLSWALNRLPLVGGSLEGALKKGKNGLKALLHGGMLFEELGFRYIGPIDGHDLPKMREYLEMVKEVKGPVLLHVFTEKGHGFAPACEDPVTFHTPPPFQRNGFDEVVSVKKSNSRAYTDVVSEAIYQEMTNDERVCVLTAAMCAGNKLGKIRQDFADRFFDVGICEGHAVAFAGGMAKAGSRPIVDIYSTFLQRSFDHIFQEVALQNLPVTFTLDRAGLCGPDGPTHHGVFDNAYMRVFPNMTVMAPGDMEDIPGMLKFCLTHDGPTSIRYPKTTAEQVQREAAPVEHGKAEVLSTGEDVTIVAWGALLGDCVRAADELRERGLSVGVINARFLKPLDEAAIVGAVSNSTCVLTVEEGTREGGFGSAVLEAANRHGVNTDNIRVLALPDQFVEHGDRADLLADLGLDTAGVVKSALEMLREHSDSDDASQSHHADHESEVTAGATEGEGGL